MGCDIHVVVERRADANSPWTIVPTRGAYERFDRYDIGEQRPLAPGEVDIPAALTRRNYDVFALLAGVRNGRGFAGIMTGAGWTPLSEPRGLPNDTTVTSDDGYDIGEHSFSYATAAELLSFFATPQRTIQTGVMDIADYKAWIRRNREYDKRRAPESYCGDVSGGGVSIATEGLNGEPPVLTPKTSHVRVTWPETQYDAAESFIEAVLPWLTALGDPDNVRLVFGFDS